MEKNVFMHTAAAALCDVNKFKDAWEIFQLKTAFSIEIENSLLWLAADIIKFQIEGKVSCRGW